MWSLSKSASSSSVRTSTGSSSPRILNFGWHKRCLYIALAILILPFTAAAQTTLHSLTLGPGTLNFDQQITTQTCSGSRGQEDYTNYYYYNFSYVDAGVTTALLGGVSEDFQGGLAGCNLPPAYPLILTLPVGAQITFVASGRGTYVASIAALVDPLYKVWTILYTAPGNASSDSFTNATTHGTVSSIGQSFSESASESFGIGFKVGVSVGVSYSITGTTGETSAFTETIADGTSIADVSSSSGPNTISHAQDLFVIWLNPEIELTGTEDTIGYTAQTQYTNGVAESPDMVQVTAAVMQASSGVTHVPLAILQRQYDPATKLYDLPGLANICASKVQYQSNCSSGGQCGCVPSDFAAILARDPLVNTSTAYNPLSADTSGASACADPIPGDKCRYVPVTSTPGSSVPETELLAGPDCSGCNRTVNGFTQTDSTTTTQTLSESIADSVSYTVRFGVGIGPTLTLGNSWTWTNSESQGSTNGTSNSLAVSLSSSTVGCSQDVSIYEDTVFHTFVFAQVPGDSSCP